MSLVSRLQGFGCGLLAGATAPLMIPLEISYLATDKSGGSWMGAAIGIFMFFVVVALFLLGGYAVANVLQIAGVTWLVTGPALYFGAWGFFGTVWLGAEEED